MKAGNVRALGRPHFVSNIEGQDPSRAKSKDLGDQTGCPPNVSQDDLYQLAFYGAVYHANRVILALSGSRAKSGSSRLALHYD